jgi:hypothetical protein
MLRERVAGSSWLNGLRALRAGETTPMRNMRRRKMEYRLLAHTAALSVLMVMMCSTAHFCTALKSSGSLQALASSSAGRFQTPLRTAQGFQNDTRSTSLASSLHRFQDSSTALCGRNDNDTEELIIIKEGEGEGGGDETKVGGSRGLSTRVIGGGTFATVTAASLGYYFLHQGEPDVTLHNLGQDLGVGMCVAVLAGIYVKIWTTLVEVDKLDPRDARKIIHTGSAPLFMLFWPFFSGAPWNRFFAVAVPFINMIRLYQAGSGTEEASLARAVSRTGDIKEALGGPFAYVVILVTTTALFWRDSMTGIMAVTALAAGDGVSALYSEHENLSVSKSSNLYARFLFCEDG